ncbi:MAG: type II secretion system major pseudopilin GspG [Fuerstiella sp.]|nr:type II secretion system major pseudopilin GspG [Fuerstiella sp.]
MNKTHLTAMCPSRSEWCDTMCRVAKDARKRGGFTLLEILLVLAILAAIASVVVPDLLTRQDKANRDTAMLTIQSAEQALKMYLVDHKGRWPDANTAVDVLVEQPPSDPRWYGPYLTSKPLDPWGQVLQIQPSRQNQGRFSFYSVGPDGREGTDDDVLSPEAEIDRNS